MAEKGPRTDSLPTTGAQSQRGWDFGVRCSQPRVDSGYPQSENGRKICLIICNANVSGLLRLKIGTHVTDQRRRKKDTIKSTFEELGYECPVIEDNKREDIMTKLAGYGDKLKNVDDFVCWILVYRTEDENGRQFYAHDERITLKDITKSFLGHTCQILAGKPKLFFIDGAYVDYKKDPHLAHSTEPRQRRDSYLIPTTADFLLGFSPFVQSVADTKYVETICQVVKEHVKKTLEGDFTTALDVAASRLVQDDVTSTYISTLTKPFFLTRR